MVANKTPSLITEFDGLRGVAIVCVLLIHTVGHYWGDGSGLRLWGQLGVPLFFAISGFCISYGIFKRAASGKTTSWVDFAQRRWHRIYPPYVLAFVIALAKVLAVGHPAISAGQMPGVLFCNLTLTQVLGPHLPIVNPVYWSLCVEFQFYLLFGCWIVMWGRGWRRISTVFCGVLFAASLGLIYVQERVTPVMPEYSWFMAFPRSAPLFFWGAAVAWLNIRLASGARLRWIHKLVLGAIATGLVFAVTWGWAIAALIIMAGLARRIAAFQIPSKLMNWFPLVYLGERSYSIYLVHDLGVSALSEYGAKIMGHNVALGLGVLIGTWVVCISMGLIYFHFVERHFLRSAPVV